MEKTGLGAEMGGKYSESREKDDVTEWDITPGWEKSMVLIQQPSSFTKEQNKCLWNFEYENVASEIK